MLKFNAERVERNAHNASTEDLLNRVTVFREDMEPDALILIEKELAERGYDHKKIQLYDDAKRDETVARRDGTPARCSFCFEPAVTHGWGWHRLFGKVPLFPRYLYWCRQHQSSS